MTMEFIIEVTQRSIQSVVILVAPTLLVSLVVGVLVSLFQAVTQINEATVSFLPKILAVALALFFSLPWMLSFFLDFAKNLWVNIPLYVR